MPAVELARLSRQMEELAAQLESPVEFRRACLRLLESYAERTRRRPDLDLDADQPWVLGVSRAVLRAIANSLTREVEGRPESARAAASALWESGIREGQALAAALVRTVTDRNAGAWAQARAPKARDGTALEYLAGPALAGWRRAEPEAFVESMAKSATVGGPRRRTYALLGLEAALSDPAFPSLPRLYQILGDCDPRSASEVRRAYQAAWGAAIRRSPPEAAQTLLEAMVEGRAAAREVVDTNLSRFPDRQKARLMRALNETEPEGIIRASE